MSGIIFFEDGTVAQFGQISTVRRIVAAAQDLLPQLLQQERDQFLETVNKAELRQIAERLAKTNDNNSNV